MKTRTYKQVEAAKRKAELAAENLMDDNDLADEFAEMSVEEYAESKGITIQNPTGRKDNNMANTANLQAELDAAYELIEELQEERTGILAVMGYEAEDDADDADGTDDEDADGTDDEDDEDDGPPLKNGGRSKRVYIFK